MHIDGYSGFRHDFCHPSLHYRNGHHNPVGFPIKLFFPLLDLVEYFRRIVFVRISVKCPDYVLIPDLNGVYKLLRLIDLWNDAAGNPRELFGQLPECPNVIGFNIGDDFS